MKTTMGTRDNSRWRKEWRDLQIESKRPQTHSSCVTQSGDIIDANHSSYGRSYDQRVTVDHEQWCLRYGSETWREVRSILHMDLPEPLYKARFMICLKKNRLWHDILYWPVYIKHRITYTEWKKEDNTPLQGEWLQKISEFDTLQHDGQLPDGSRLYQE